MILYRALVFIFIYAHQPPLLLGEEGRRGVNLRARERSVRYCAENYFRLYRRIPHRCFSERKRNARPLLSVRDCKCVFLWVSFSNIKKICLERISSVFFYFCYYAFFKPLRGSGLCYFRERLFIYRCEQEHVADIGRIFLFEFHRVLFICKSIGRDSCRPLSDYVHVGAGFRRCVRMVSFERVR